MPRATPKRTPPPELAPRRVEVSLLVLEHFRDPSGAEWRPGDRAPLHRRALRQTAFERPELFAMEYETHPVDLEWLRELDQEYEQEYEQLKRRRDEQEKRRERALRDELKTQDAPQPELERRYKKQEAEREKREKQAREQHERQMIENELTYRSGFNV